MTGVAAAPETGVTLTDASGIVVATLDRPTKANALTPSMLTALTAAVSALDPAAPGLVIQGQHGRFSGGIDLAAARAGSADAAGSAQSLLSALVEAIASCPAPVAALIDGACVGGAVELAVSCDVRIGTTGATFRIPATEIGIVYRPEGCATLAGRLGTDVLRPLLLLGSKLDAPAALAAGLLDAVVDDPLAAAAQLFARLGSVPGTFAAQKRALRVLAEASGPRADVLAEMGRIREAHASARDARAAQA